MKLSALVGPLLVAVFLAGCAPLQPYRIVEPTAAYDPAGPCNPSPPETDDVGGRVPDACGNRMREDARSYRLYFTEFDDQGWPFPGTAGSQAKVLFKDLEALLDQEPDSKLSVVVFVHGWKHDATSGDNNVRAFRHLLESLKQVEDLKGLACQRKVVGLYVGWRGSGLMLGDPAENLTFYSRKSAAQKVAQGSVRLVFSKLRALQDSANAEWNRKVQAELAIRLQATAAARPVAQVASVEGAKGEKGASAQAPQASDTCQRRMRLSIAGHSFGGLIVYSALAQSLIKDLMELRQAEDAAAGSGTGRPPLSREGDLVVVINPAIEATRYDPLHRAANDEPPLPHYHAPLFVAITSSDDQATGRAFPAGRQLNTLFERYPPDAKEAEKNANLHAFGQTDAYLSHDLEPVAPRDEAASACADWRRPSLPLADRVAIEKQVGDAFERRLAAAGYDAGAAGVFPRLFCSVGTIRLTPRATGGPGGPNAPIWNVRTRDPIVKSHGDITNPMLIDVLRQLYMDGERTDFGN